MSYNCRSIRNKVHEVMDLVREDGVDILLVQETWLRKCDAPIIKEIEEYGFKVSSERKRRATDLGGGVAIIY